MTVVVNPAGSSTVIYSRSGTAVISLTPTGSDQTGAAAISTPAGRAVLVCAYTGSGGGVVLPSSPEIGDVVEVYPFNDAGSEMVVYPSTGKGIGARDVNVGVPITSGGLYRYVAIDRWGEVSVNSGNGGSGMKLKFGYYPDMVLVAAGLGISKVFWYTDIPGGTAFNVWVVTKNSYLLSYFEGTGNIPATFSADFPAAVQVTDVHGFDNGLI